jgi:hypothetical protein
MSYAQATDLLRVTEMAMSRFDGIALQALTEEFGCDHRTAQRMMRSFETVSHPRQEMHDDPDAILTVRFAAATGLSDAAIVQIGAQASTLTTWLAEQGYDRLHFELPLQEIAADGSETNALVDCLAEGPTGLLIVEHKSGPCPDPATRFANYQPQLNAYADMVRRKWPDKPVTGTATFWMSEGTLSLAQASIKEPV